MALADDLLAELRLHTRPVEASLLYAAFGLDVPSGGRGVRAALLKLRNHGLVDNLPTKQRGGADNGGDLWFVTVLGRRRGFYRRVTEVQPKIVAALEAAGGSATSTELQDATGAKRPQLWTALRDLRKRGVVSTTVRRPDGPGRLGRAKAVWALVPVESGRA